MRFRVYCNFLILEIGGLKLFQHQKRECSYLNRNSEKILHLEHQKMDKVLPGKNPHINLREKSGDTTRSSTPNTHTPGSVTRFVPGCGASQR